MAGDSTTSRIPLITGVNHRSGSLTLRDKLFVEDADVPDFLEKLRDLGIDQAVVLSTCDRVEVITMSGDSDRDQGIIVDAFSQHAGLPNDEVTSAMKCHMGTEAVRHLFRVASSLESVVVGEPQVLGQVKACHRMARDHGAVSGDLERLLQSAYSAAKRVRTETAIGERPVSIAAVAVGIAREVHGRLEDTRALLIGTGDMGEVIAEELQRGGLGVLSVCEFGRPAADMIERLGAYRIEPSDLTAALADADVIVTAIGGRAQALSADMVRLALKARRSRPQFIVDASLPRDVETAVDRLDDAFLYDLADLERLAMEGQARRSFEAESAEHIVLAEVEGYQKGRAERTATPALSALRRHVAALRESVLLEAGNDAEKATHLLVQRLLHTPSERLRAKAHSGEDIAAAERMIRDLFDIADDGDDKP
ncbi:glutamyl-tRNA reductase [Thalassospiraceae bacterium LMO-JJ14]|nr:glutamyl-tRNA reductase [Thalassospiraceae bacterium LMO-JJ14]